MLRDYLQCSLHYHGFQIHRNPFAGEVVLLDDGDDKPGL